MSRRPQAAPGGPQACIVHEKGGGFAEGSVLGKSNRPLAPKEAPASVVLPCRASRSSLRPGHRGRGPLSSVPHLARPEA